MAFLLVSVRILAEVGGLGMQMAQACHLHTVVSIFATDSFHPALLDGRAGNKIAEMERSYFPI
jgi:hypothetical protein